MRYVKGQEVETVYRHLGLGRPSYFRLLNEVLKAISVSLESESVRRPGSNQLPPRMHATPLVGREKEIKLLRDAFNSVASNQTGQVVTIAGQQGIGKTRLAQELGQWVREKGGLFLEGRWGKWDRAAPYSALTEALRKGLREVGAREESQIVGPYSKDLSRLFPDFFDTSHTQVESEQQSPEEKQHRLYEGVATLVEGMSRKQPLVILLNDLHLAPQMNLQLHIAERIEDCPVLIVYTYRKTELDERPALVSGMIELNHLRLVTDIHLAPLHEVETGKMIAYIFGDEVAGQLQAPTYVINKGNPFFLEEMLRYLVEKTAVRWENGRWRVVDTSRIRIPEAIKMLVHERVARLGDDMVDLLRQASVLGQEFSFAALSQAAGRTEDDLLGMLDQAMTADILTESPGTATAEGIGFTEEHVREVIYESIPSIRRRRYHQRAGQALRSLFPDRLEELAYHFTHGTDAELGASYSFQAAERASSLFSWSRAIPLYQSALDLWEDL